MNTQIFRDLLLAKDYKAVRSVLNVMNEVDIASLLSELDDKSLTLAFRLIPKTKAADVFAEMSNTMQSYLVEIFTQQELKELLENLYMDDTVDMLEELPANLVTRILENVSHEKRTQINQLLNYPEDSAGSIMTTEYVNLRKTTTVASAMAYIKKIGIHRETIYTCYVLEQRKLIGIVTAKDLMTLDDDVTMEEFMETEIISVTTHTDQEEAARLFSRYGFLALPVLDNDDRMVGIITVDDAMEVMEEETTEDMSIMSAVNPSENTYFDSSVMEQVKNRIPWLLILMFSSTITGAILSSYEEAIAAVPLLVSFIPMLMDTGGNCGSQSSALVIRGIALDQIQFSDIFKVMFKEFRISIIASLILAFANGLRIYLMYGHNLILTIVICLSLIATVIIAKIIGCTLPLLAQRIHLDPALMASPIITTLVDTCSIIIYFFIATRLLDLNI